MKSRVLTALTALALATPAAAGARWYTTYATGHKLAEETGRPMIVVFDRPGDSTLRNAQRMFDNPKVARFTRYFVCIFLEVSIQNNSFSHPQFSKYNPGPGGHRFPLIFLADAKEKVLEKAEGSPNTTDLAKTLVAALRAHGPVADPSKLRKAAGQMKLAEAYQEKEKTSRAAPLYQEVMELAPNTPLAEKAKAKLAEIEAVANRELESARLDIKDKAYPEAVEKLKALRRTYPTLKAGKEAAAEMAKLADSAEAKAALEGETETPSVREVDTSDYAFTDEELDALDALGRGTEEIRTGDAQAAAKAERLLRMARNWQANKQPYEARKCLRMIIDRYPNTDQAETAKRLLTEIK